MKPWQIALFIILIITCLGIISFFFPEEGITLAKHTINFPSIENVLADPDADLPDLPGDSLSRDKRIPRRTLFNRKKREAIIAEIAREDSIKQRQVAQQLDTLEHFKTTLASEGHFYLPDGDITYFDKFFARAAAAKGNGEVLRVLHYGDSQIEMDRISGNLRSYFQSKFGGGGPGLLPAVQTVASYAVSQSASGPFTLYSSYGDGGRARGNYGLMMKCYRLTGGGTFTANATSNKRSDNRVKRFSRVTLLYNDYDGKFRATLSDRKHGYDSSCLSAGKGIHAFHWQTDSSTASLRINMQGNADIYGIMIDNGPGVSVDNIPLRSSSGTQFTVVTDSVLRKCYQNSNVGMIIMQFGGNTVPSVYSTKSINDYCAQMQKQIRRVKSACPNATILFIGPSDMSHSYGGSLQTYKFLPAMIDSLRNMCLRNHVAYWDLYEVMGGRNSMVAWVKKGWAGPDYVHFTPTGANYVGKTLAENFATLYELYTTRRKMGNQQFDNLWEAAEK